MTEPESPQEQVPAEPVFGAERVDPLVYRRDAEDIPELRPAAANVNAGYRVVVRDAPPEPVAPAEHREWTPAGTSGPAQEAPAQEPVAAGRPALRALLATALILAPLAALAAFIALALGLYR